MEETKTLTDLIEYLERTGILPNKPEMFSNWRTHLGELREREEQEQKIRKSKAFLEHEGYIVVHDESEIDAVRMKKWVQSQEPDLDVQAPALQHTTEGLGTLPPDEDIPF